jgi:hypothetical protein
VHHLELPSAQDDDRSRYVLALKRMDAYWLNFLRQQDLT